MNVMKAGKRYAAWTAGIVSLSMAFAMSGCASKYGPADAVTYVESVLDASYRAEFEEYAAYGFYTGRSTGDVSAEY